MKRKQITCTKNEKGFLSSNTIWDRYHHHHSVYGKNNMYMQTGGFSLIYRQPLHLWPKPFLENVQKVSHLKLNLYSQKWNWGFVPWTPFSLHKNTNWPWTFFNYKYSICFYKHLLSKKHTRVKCIKYIWKNLENFHLQNCFIFGTSREGLYWRRYDTEGAGSPASFKFGFTGQESGKV